MDDPGTYGSDEYIVLAAFLVGMLVHGMLTVRTGRRMLGTAGAFAAALVAAWFLADAGSERWMQTLFFTGITFAVIFAVAFRSQLMPVVSAAGLGHYTLLLYYVLALSVRDAGVDLPTPVLAVASLPALVALGLILAARRAGPFLKKVAYAWFLVLLTVLVLQQVAMMAEVGPRRGEAPLVEAAAWFFFLGPLWLYFIANLVYLIMMMPALRAGEARFWRAVLGEEDDDVRHRREAARRFLALPIAPLRLALLGFHAALLAANWHLGFLPHGLLVSGSVTLLALGESWSWNAPAAGVRS